MVYAPDTYSETAFVSIQSSGGTDREYMTITETIGIKNGAKNIDVKAMIGGGRLVQFNPQEPTEITLECYPVFVSTSSGATGTGFYDLLYTSSDITEPISITNDRTRPKVRCSILWTTDTTATKATGATSVTSAGYRLTCINGYVVSVDEDFGSGDAKKATVKLVFPPFNKAGTGNLTYESAESAILPALSSYTAS
jgi:hypothetical protein